MSCRRATSDTTATGVNDSATIRPLSALFHRPRPPTPLRISTRPRGAEASTIWSTIYANRCHQQVRIFRTMPLAARWGKDTAYDIAGGAVANVRDEGNAGNAEEIACRHAATS